jgi:hypothetical protein
MDIHVFLSTLNKLKDNTTDFMLAPNYKPPHNPNIGYEFLDDACQMKDKPRMFTEESIAAGCRDDLL